MQFDEEEENEQVQQIEIPKYKILFQDLKEEQTVREVESVLNTDEKDETILSEETSKIEEKKKLVDKILEHAAESLENSDFDKDIAAKLKALLDEDVELNKASITDKNFEEHGVWQVVIGRQFYASITFDANFLIYFLFEDLEKYFLVFRS